MIKQTLKLKRVDTPYGYIILAVSKKICFGQVASVTYSKIKEVVN